LIKVTKLNGELFYVNPYEIEFIEETPDTVISLKSGKKMIVSEKAQIVIRRMIEFYRLANVVPKIADDELPSDRDKSDYGDDDAGDYN
jgi:flagellar protein FlbD